MLYLSTITATVFENHSKCRIWISINFHQVWTCLVTLFDHKLQVFKTRQIGLFIGIFNELLSTQNGNVARFARNETFSVIFNQCGHMQITKPEKHQNNRKSN